MRGIFSTIVGSLVTIPLFAQAVLAQQVTTDPASTHIYPAGGQRGTTVAVRVGGECLPPHTRIRWFGDGITAPGELGPKAAFRGEPSLRRKPGETPMNYPQDWESSVTIAPDATLGTRLWRLSCGRGGTGGRVFVVGDLPEYLETESNSTPDRAERVTLPVTLNGQIDGERDMDYYVFSAAAGQVISAEVAAARLGSPLDAVVEFFDPDGRRVAVDQARIGGDSVLAFRAPTTGDYRLSVAHLSFQGGPHYVYRLTLTTAPCVSSAFPAGWQAGQSRDFELLTLTGGGDPAVLQQRIALAADAVGETWWRGGGIANGLLLRVGLLPEAIEAEPNDRAAESTPLTWPATMNGRFGAANDEDWYTFAAQPDAPLSIECQGATGGPVLPIVEILDASGGVLATASAVEAADMICRIEAWRAPAAGEYRLRVRDLRQGSAGGPEFVYRLAVSQSVPDFALSLPVDFANVLPGGRTEFEVRARHIGGLTAPIDVTVEDLPQGVTAEPLQFAPGQAVAKLVLNAADDARPGDVPVRIVGTATSDVGTLVHVAAATHQGHDLQGVGLGPTTVEHLQLTVQHKPVFRLYCNEAYQYAYRGTIYPYLMEVERLDGFDGPITLEMADRQIKDLDGIELVHTTIPPGSSSVMLPIYLPETMHINVQAHSNVYSQGHVTFTDRWGQKQSLLVVSTMRCMIRPLPTVARLEALEDEMEIATGGTATIRMRLDRTANFAGGVRVELLPHDKLTGFSADTVAISADESECEITVRAASDAVIRDDAPLTFRAIGDMPGGVKLVSEARVAVRLRPNAAILSTAE
jgi:hypothetical protein